MLSIAALVSFGYILTFVTRPDGFLHLNFQRFSHVRVKEHWDRGTSLWLETGGSPRIVISISLWLEAGN
jgi:hypothetical protein